MCVLVNFIILGPFYTHAWLLRYRNLCHCQHTACHLFSCLSVKQLVSHEELFSWLFPWHHLFTHYYCMYSPSARAAYFFTMTIGFRDIGRVVMSNACMQTWVEMERLSLLMSANVGDVNQGHLNVCSNIRSQSSQSSVTVMMQICLKPIWYSDIQWESSSFTFH